MNAMSSVDTRNVARDSLFLFAQLTFAGQAKTYRVKVRNLSAGGMMAETSEVAASRGDRLEIELRNVGTVKGSVAWAQDNRFGVAFEKDIDPKVVRAPVGSTAEIPHYVRSTSAASTFSDDERRIRKL
ncbi:PilZ domain-containing protein [Qipengyuania mesophila]|nr:PilZ domain-containing protein [Qipengyuania mesophila]